MLELIYWEKSTSNIWIARISCWVYKEQCVKPWKNITNFWQKLYKVSLWGFQILNGVASTADLTKLILAIKIVHLCCDASDVDIF